MKARVINLTEGRIWEQVLLFSIPLLLSNLLQQLYSAVDLIIVGNFAGENEMAAIGSTAAITNMIINFFLGLAVGCSVVVAQYFGSDDYENLQKAIHSTYAIAIAGGLFLMVSGYFATPFCLGLMQTPADIMEDAVTYMRIILAGSVPLLIYNMGAGILRSVGDSKRPFYFLVLSTFTNLVLDIIFVYFFRWGVAGAGWATMISQVVSTLLVSFSLIEANTIYHLTLRKINFHGQTCLEIIRIGFPAGIQGTLIAFSNVLIQSMVNSFGPVAIGGVAAASRLDGIVFSVLNSFSLAATTFAGQNYGAGLRSRLKRGAKEISALTFICTFAIGMLVFLARYPLVRLFTSSPDIVLVGTRMMAFLTPFYWLLGLVYTLSGYIRGVGESLRPMLIILFGMCFFRLVYLYIALDIDNSLDMIFLCYPVSWVLTLLIIFLYFEKGKWRKLFLDKLQEEKVVVKEADEVR